MHQLLFLFAEFMPVNEIVTLMEVAIEKYKTEPSEENLKALEMHCMLLCSKRAVKENGLEKTIAEVDRSHAMSNRFKDVQ